MKSDGGPKSCQKFDKKLWGPEISQIRRENNDRGSKTGQMGQEKIMAVLRWVKLVVKN